MTYRQLLAILEQHGFEFERPGKGSHRIYQSYHTGRRWIVVLAYRNMGEDVKLGTLSSIIRQSGLAKDVFR